MKGIQAALCLLVGALAMTDYKNKRIPLWPIGAAWGIGILNLYLQHYEDWKSMLGGMGMGIAICLLSKAVNNPIGTGDGLVIAVIGMFMGAKFTFFCIGEAFLLSAFAALFLICMKRAGKKDKMPFIPYIFVAYIITICMEAGGQG